MAPALGPTMERQTGASWEGKGQAAGGKPRRSTDATPVILGEARYPDQAHIRVPGFAQDDDP